ncbi:hypothetical protein C8R42DRAFT_605495 [Lentinula raphanica]|nr:hypothetical protein C8R42DRAFT_605495 [Lentinula raphanica]
MATHSSIATTSPVDGASAPRIQGAPGPTDYTPIETSPPPPAVSSTSNTDQVHSKSRSTTPFIESEIYAKMLLLRKNGYPLWEPKTENALYPEIYQEKGSHIGDVGILNLFGGFDYLFNVCHEATHPLNVGRVPDNFKPIPDFNANDVLETKYRLGDYVLSDPKQIHQSRVQGSGNQFEGVPKEFGEGQAFSSTTSTGAILILPEGGKRVDYLRPEIFANYAADHAASWYTHATVAMGRETRNGSLYLITGFDKARAWGSATFRNANAEDVSLEFVPESSRGNSSYPSYDFRICHSAAATSDADGTYGEQSGSVFLRGYKIALRHSWFRRMIPGIINASDFLDPDRSFRFLKHPVSWLLSLSLLDWIKRQFSSDHIVDFYSVSNARAYHPSDAINSWLLRHTRADIALSHDDAWAAVIRDDDKEMPDTQELLLRVRANKHCIQYGTTSRGHKWVCLRGSPLSFSRNANENLKKHLD